MGKYMLKNDVPIEIQKKRKQVLGSVSMSGQVFDKMPIYVVRDEEYERFWSIKVQLLNKAEKSRADKIFVNIPGKSNKDMFDDLLIVNAHQFS